MHTQMNQSNVHIAIGMSKNCSVVILGVSSSLHILEKGVPQTAIDISTTKLMLRILFESLTILLGDYISARN